MLRPTSDFLSRRRRCLLVAHMRAALERGTKRGDFTVIARAAREADANGNRSYLVACARCKRLHKVPAQDLSNTPKCPAARRTEPQRLEIVPGEMVGDIQVIGAAHPRIQDGHTMVAIKCASCGLRMQDLKLSHLRSKYGPRSCRSCSKRLMV